MDSQKLHEDEGLIIKLTVDETSIEEVEVKITDPAKTIRNQISRIISVFKLPKIDNGGNPIQYILGQTINGEDEPEILEFEDEYGRELTLNDYNIRSGDHLQLISVFFCGGIWCNILIVKNWRIKLLDIQSLKIYKVKNRKDIDICRLHGCWIDEIINNLVQQCNLPSDRQYYLARLYRDSNSNLRFYFLNGEKCSMNSKISIFDYSEDLNPKGKEYPDVILFPTSGISKRIMKKIDKYYNHVTRFMTI